MPPANYEWGAVQLEQTNSATRGFILRGIELRSNGNNYPHGKPSPSTRLQTKPAHTRMMIASTAMLEINQSDDLDLGG